MVTSMAEMYRLFLTRRVTLGELRQWLAVDQWNLQGVEREMADVADSAIVFYDDGHIDDEDLRRWLSWELSKTSVYVEALHFGEETTGQEWRLQPCRVNGINRSANYSPDRVVLAA